MNSLEEPAELKREVKFSTEPLPDLENAKFTVNDHSSLTEKIIIAYDIAGNPIECSIEEIINNKYRPKPDFGITEVEPKKKADDGKTRSGKCYRHLPKDLTAEMMR
jgi:hypothetical protein